MVSLLALPPEIRLNIFSHVLRFDSALQKLTTVLAESLKDISVGNRPDDDWLDNEFELDVWPDDDYGPDHKLADTSIFLTCKLLHQEALDVFYEQNRFKIHYQRLCRCNGSFRTSAFNEARIRHLEIYNFSAQDSSAGACSMCQDAGLGMIRHVTRLPRLRSLTVALNDYMFIGDLVDRARADPALSLLASEVGRFTMYGLRIPVPFCLPRLSQAWKQAAEMAADIERDGQTTRETGEDNFETALEYLQFEFQDYYRVPSAMERFFQHDVGGGKRRFCLRLRNHSDSSRRILDFTVALTEVLGDLFVDEQPDLGWNELEDDGFEVAEWDFREGMDSRGDQSGKNGARVESE